MIGCFRLPIGYICEDLQWDRETALQTLAELVRLGFATVDYEAQWVLIHDFLELNPIGNPNQAKAAAKLVDQVPTDSCVYDLVSCNN